MATTHWLGERVSRIDTTLEQLPRILPTFERRAFGRNRFHDVIERAVPQGMAPLPVGVVSKKYVLVQHADAVAAVTREVRDAGIRPGSVRARVFLSEYGTRMALRATLPTDYDFTPPDGHRMALTYECFNSVDKSVPLCAAVGWFRFVCSNGLIVGTTMAKVRIRHAPPLEIDEISEVLADGMRTAIADRESFHRWQSIAIDDSALAGFVDGPIARTWGPTAAARVYAISTFGIDGQPLPTRKAAPHRWRIANGRPVPGTPAPCRDAYQIAQVLAWVSSRRDNFAKRLEWRDEIRGLMSELIPAAA
jgi:hypothetical protein